MVEDPAILWIVAGLFITVTILGILFLVVYNKYYNLKHDPSKYVVLRDFAGNKNRIGKYISFGMTKPAPQEENSKKWEKNTEPKPIINIQTKKGEIQSWIIDFPAEYSTANISIDYGDELTILCDFANTDIDRHIVVPFVDKSILEIGLRRGISAIINKINPLFNQIELLKHMLQEREDVIQKIAIEYDADKLDFINKSRIANKKLIDEVKKEFLMGLLWVKARAQAETSKQLKGTDQTIEADLKKLNEEAKIIKYPDGQESAPNLGFLNNESSSPKEKPSGTSSSTKGEAKDRATN